MNGTGRPRVASQNVPPPTPGVCYALPGNGPDSPISDTAGIPTAFRPTSKGEPVHVEGEAVSRSKSATPEEIQGVISRGLARIRDALSLQRANKSIQSRMAQLAWEWHFWNRVLHLKKTKSRKEFRELFTPAPADVAEFCRGPSLTVADLGEISQLLQAVETTISSRKPGLSVSLLRFVIRRAEAPQPRARKLKDVYVEGFRRRVAARGERKLVTASALARQLTPAQYEKNPDTATRNMQRGLARVRREHDRCVKLGIPSPFLP